MSKAWPNKNLKSVEGSHNLLIILRKFYDYVPTSTGNVFEIKTCDCVTSVIESLPYTLNTRVTENYPWREITPRGKLPPVEDYRSWEITPRGKLPPVENYLSWEITPRGKLPLVGNYPSWAITPRGKLSLVENYPPWKITPRGKLPPVEN